MKKFILLACIFITFTVHAQEDKIAFQDVFLKMPETSWNGLKLGFSKESIPWWVGIAGSTWILYNNDEVILRDVQADGRRMGIGNEDKTKAALSIGEIDIIRLPTDTGSWMYFLGDGWMHGGIALGFSATGYFTEDNRAYNTGLRIMHGMMVSTIFSQLLKRASGRESPYVRTEYQGRWSPFPSPAAYQEKTSTYDAYPSGHVMTATLTFTIINDAYPEYAPYLLPAELLWVTALGWQMVNNGVHWASDYPLGIAMGYVFGKAAAQLGKPQIDKVTKTQWMITPFMNQDSNGLAWTLRY